MDPSHRIVDQKSAIWCAIDHDISAVEVKCPLLPQGIENPLKSPGNVWNQVDSICGDDMVGHIFAYGICKRAILIVALVQKIARYLLLALKKIIGFAQPCR